MVGNWRTSAREKQRIGNNRSAAGRTISTGGRVDHGTITGSSRKKGQKVIVKKRTKRR